MDYFSNGGTIGKRRLYNSTILSEIIYVGGATAGATGTTSDINISLTSLTGGNNSSPQPGDLVIVAVNYAATSDIAYNISGYTQIADLYANDSFDTNLMIGYKFMTDTPDSSIVLTGGSGSTANAYAYAVQVWRNVDKTIIFDATTTTSTTTNSGIPNPPAISSTSSDQSQVIVIGAAAHNGGVDTFTATYLNNFLTAGGNSTNDSAIGMGNIAGYYSSGYDPAAFTFSQTDATTFSAAAATLALRPASKYPSSGIWKLQETEFEQISTTGSYAYFVSATTQSANSTSMPVPSGLLAGDLLVYVFAADVAASGFPAAPTGFTVGNSTGDTTGGLMWAYKIADGTETTISPIDNGRTTENIHAALIFRKARVANSGSAQTTSGATITPPSISVSARDLVVIITSMDSSAVVTATGPTGYTEIIDAAGTQATIYLGIKSITASGTETPGAVSYGSTNGDNDYSATFSLAYSG